MRTRKIPRINVNLEIDEDFNNEFNNLSSFFGKTRFVNNALRYVAHLNKLCNSTDTTLSKAGAALMLGDFATVDKEISKHFLRS